jgi:hypothetical protein
LPPTAAGFETALAASGERTHKILAAVYGDTAQPEYVRDNLDLWHYLAMREMEPPVRELSGIFGGLELECELRRAWTTFRRDFAARKQPRKSAKSAPEVSYLSWQQ